MSRRLWTWSAAALLPAGVLCVAASYAAQAPRQAPRKPPAASQKGGGPGPTLNPQPSTLNVVFSTETNGYLAPCGCSSPMMGGFPRRGAYLAALAKEGPLVRVDNGDLTEAMGRQDELKADALVDMLNAMQYDAVGLGEKDFRLSVPYLQSLQARMKGPFLCANARKADGSPLFGEYTVVNRTVAGKPLRVLVAALLSDQYAAQAAALNPDLTLEAPSVALERLRGDLASKADVRVLLYHGPRTEAESLAQQFPLFQLVVYGHEGDHPLDPVRSGATTLVCNGEDGKFMGCARLASPTAVPVVKYTALGPEYKDDPAVLQIKRAYLDRVTSEGLLAKVPRGATPNGDRFAGSAACLGCHAEPHRVWKASGHARALQTLAAVKEDQDPECVACHVVGMAQVGGFTSRAETPQLADVGCESCHGPAARHAADPKNPMPKAGPEACNACHVPQHSPKFDYAAYWAKIKHSLNGRARGPGKIEGVPMNETPVRGRSG